MRRGDTPTDPQFAGRQLKRDRLIVCEQACRSLVRRNVVKWTLARSPARPGSPSLDFRCSLDDGWCG